MKAITFMLSSSGIAAIVGLLMKYPTNLGTAWCVAYTIGSNGKEVVLEYNGNSTAGDVTCTLTVYRNEEFGTPNCYGVIKSNITAPCPSLSGCPAVRLALEL